MTNEQYDVVVESLVFFIKRTCQKDTVSQLEAEVLLETVKALIELHRQRITFGNES